MIFYRQTGLLAKIKWIFGMVFVVATLMSSLVAGNPTTDKIEFKISDVTTESEAITATVTNHGNFAVGYNILIESLERKVGDTWEEVKYKDEVNLRELSAPTFPYKYLFPSETWEAEIAPEKLFEDGEFVPGEYRITYSYRMFKGESEEFTSSCEFAVKVAE